MTSTSCTKCKEEAQQYSVDIMMAFAERTIKRQWITIIILIVIVASMICGYLYHESLYEDVVTTEQTIESTQDGEGTNIVNGGDLTYESEGKDKDNNH